MERRQPALGPVERTELCLQVGCTAAEAMMESKEVWSRGQKEEVRVFHWKYDHAGGKLSALSHVREMLMCLIGRRDASIWCERR